MGDDVTTRQLWPLIEPSVPVSNRVEPSPDREQPTQELEREDATDLTVPGRAPWDKPGPLPSEEAEALDDRPAEMLATYDEMIPTVDRAVAAAAVPAAQSPVSDPDDAFAPVLDDIHERPRATWPAWNSVETPPPADGLLDLPRQKPVLAPHVFSTAADSPQEPLVLRLELPVADEPTEARVVDAARPDGPWSDALVEGPSVARSDSQFAPRNLPSDYFPPPETPQEVPPVPEAVAHRPTAEIAVPAADLRPAWPPADDIDHSEPQRQTLSHAHEPDPWTRAPASADPLTTLPAATLASRLAQRTERPWVPERVSVLEAMPVFEPPEDFQPAAAGKSARTRTSRRRTLVVAGLAVMAAVIVLAIVLTTSLLR